MTTDDAKKILSFYRPGSVDARDPEFVEALELVRRTPANARWLTQQNPELSKWFDEHCAQFSAARAKFRALPVPAGLKEQILAERKVVALPAPKSIGTAHWLALAAGFALVACVLTLTLRRHNEPAAFIACRNQMVRQALTPYFMDLETTNQDRIRAYLAERSAPSNYLVPPRLAAANMVGCAIKYWNNSPVSLICFRSGRPLRGGDSADLWLFVVDTSLVPGGPNSTTPNFAPVSRATVASWTHDQHTYILVGAGDKSFVEKYLD